MFVCLHKWPHLTTVLSGASGDGDGDGGGEAASAATTPAAAGWVAGATYAGDGCGLCGGGEGADG